MRKPTKEIRLTSYDDLLGIKTEQQETDKVVMISLAELYSFKNHPFQVNDDEKMQETVESIRRNGVLVPALVRPRSEGGYEIVAGHRRKRGSELAGKEVMPVIIHDYTDDEATVIMVDSNIQRENLLPSEKAFAYKMKMEALKHQGLKTDCQGETADIVGKEAGDSGRTVQRYICLTKLITELLQMVDTGKIKFVPAVNISKLSTIEQQWVFQCMVDHGVTIDTEASKVLKKYSEDQELTELAVKLILCKEKSSKERITLSDERIRQYFPIGYSKKEIEEIIYTLLDEWKQKQ